MNDEPAATEPTKTALENSVSWYLADKMQDASVSIATKKYLTNDNTLIYLTRCTVAETSVPRIKVQVLKRVPGGIQETGYQLFGDHRMTKYVNEMIFGNQPGGSDGNQQTEVSDKEANEVLALVNALADARQTL
jgi:hypothetical protein